MRLPTDNKYYTGILCNIHIEHCTNNVNNMILLV